MKEPLEVVPGVLMSLDGLRVLRIVPAEAPSSNTDVFPISLWYLLRAEYAIGTSYDLAFGSELEMRDLYSCIRNRIMPSDRGESLHEERASPIFPLDTPKPADTQKKAKPDKKSWAEVVKESEK